MSTDYGFRCVDCGASLIDSYSQWAISSINSSVSQLSAFGLAYWNLRVSGCVDFRISSDFGDVDIGRLLDFFRVHGDHTLLIVDEYGDRQYYVDEATDTLIPVGRW